MKKYIAKYWNHKGKYQKGYEKLYKQLVPNQGKATTQEGELLRAACNVYYDQFNNGGLNLTHGFGRYDDLLTLLQLVPTSMKASASIFCKPFMKEKKNKMNVRMQHADKFIDWVVCYIDAQLALKKVAEEAQMKD